MFTVIKSEYGQLLGDCKVRGTYEALEDAERALMNELWHDAKASGSDDDGVHTWLDAAGMPCGEHDASESQWRIFEVPSPVETKPYIAHIMVPLSIYFRAVSEEDARYVAETIAADPKRLHDLLGKVFADSGTNAHVAELADDSDDHGYADIPLDASEVAEILSEQDDYK